MPWTLQTKDGITLNNIPDDVTPDSQMLKDRVAAIRADRDAGSAPQAQPYPDTPAGREARAKDELAALQGFPSWQAAEEAAAGGGAAGAMGAVVRGAGPQAAMTAINPALGGVYAGTTAVMDPITELLNTVLPEDMKQMPPSQGIQYLLSQLGIKEPQTATERILQAGSQGLAGARGAVDLGKLIAGGGMQAPSTVSRVGGALAAQPGQQMAGGVGGAAAAQMVADAGGDPATQFGAGLAGSVLGAAGMKGAQALRGIDAPQGPLTPQEQMVADAQGRSLMTSDVFPPQGGGGKLVQLLSEKNPFFGTGPMRAEQQKDRIDAIDDLLKQYGAGNFGDMADNTMQRAIVDSLKESRSTELGRNIALKNDVITRLSEGGNTSTGNAVVPVPRATAVIDAQIAKLKGMNNPEVNPAIEKLASWRSAIQNQNLGNIELNRSQFGESFNDPGLGAAAGQVQKAFNAVYGGLRDDMGEFIKANGKRGDYDQWANANANLKESIEELERGTLKNLIDKGDLKPETANALLFSAAPSDVQSLYKNLTPEGRANARTAILMKAAQNAYTSGTENLSPEKFVSQVQKLGGPVGVFFNGDDKAAVEGLVRYVNSTRRATQAGLNPPTGIQTLIPQLSLGSAGFISGSTGGGPMGGVTGLLSTIAGASTLGAASRIYESKPVRDLLIKLSRAPDGARGAFVKRLGEAIRAEQAVNPNMSATALEQQNQGAQ